MNMPAAILVSLNELHHAVLGMTLTIYEVDLAPPPLRNLRLLEDLATKNERCEGLLIAGAEGT